MKQEAITTESLLEIMNHQLEVIDNKDIVIEQKDKIIVGLQRIFPPKIPHNSQ